MSNSLFDKIMEIPDPTKAKIPLWIHIILRILLQTSLGVGIWFFWDKSVLLVLFLGILFVYHIITLFFGEQIRNTIYNMMGNL